jgi:hypothetical protein
MAELIKLLGSLAALYHLLGRVGTLVLLGVLAGLCWFLYAYGGQILEGLIMHHARSLGQALRDATITVHAITPAPEPDRSVWIKDEDDAQFEADLEASGMPDGEFDWYKLDLTITPKSVEGVEKVCWTPSAVQVVKAGAEVDALEFNMHCLVAQVEWWNGNQFELCEVEDAHGEKRLRLYAGVPPRTEHVRLNYLGQTFGDLHLPWARQAAPARAASPQTTV